jgi:hypothetical protein
VLPEYGPNLSKVTQDQFQRRVGIQLSTKQARELVSRTNMNQTTQFLFGYHLLPQYLQHFRAVDSGNVAELQYDSSTFAPNSFFGLFQAMGPVIRGFSELQEISICVSDCAHLYDKNFGGVIISAVTIDCNHELIPLAWWTRPCCPLRTFASLGISTSIAETSTQWYYIKANPSTNPETQGWNFGLCGKGCKTDKPQKKTRNTRIPERRQL